VSPRRPATLAAALLLVATHASACELRLFEHREARELARLVLDPGRLHFRVAFTHSVLGTPVEDRYEFRPGPNGWRAVLVEERWQGEGYGLPIAAGPGETLSRDGDGWRLRLSRVVHPLVVRALPSQRMRVIVDDRAPLLLGSLGARAVEMRLEHCSTRAVKEPG
jgi:hypothetical protein